MRDMGYSAMPVAHYVAHRLAPVIFAKSRYKLTVRLCHTAWDASFFCLAVIRISTNPQTNSPMLIHCDVESP